MPDLEDFMSDRGFNVPLDRMPFPYAETPEGLCALVENYSEEESRRCISAHLEAMGSFEKEQRQTRWWILSVRYVVLYPNYNFQ